MKNRKSYWKQYHKNWYLKNKQFSIDDATRRQKENLCAWSKIVPQKTQCEICGKSIVFNNRKNGNFICFDHRNGGKEEINGSPFSWLRNHKVLPHNVEIWKNCNFGTLCNTCNLIVPTKRRVEHLEKALAYAKKTETR